MNFGKDYDGGIVGVTEVDDRIQCMSDGLHICEAMSTYPSETKSGEHGGCVYRFHCFY
jgi:hypothetical protein